MQGNLNIAPVGFEPLNDLLNWRKVSDFKRKTGIQLITGANPVPALTSPDTPALTSPPPRWGHGRNAPMFNIAAGDFVSPVRRPAASTLRQTRDTGAIFRLRENAK